MKQRSLVVLSIVVFLATVVFSAALIAQQRPAQPAAQAQATPARPAQPAPATAAKPAATQATKAYTAPKTPDGFPDLQGYWTNGTYTTLERPANVNKEFYTEEEYKAMLKTRANQEEEQTVPGTTADVHYDFTQFALDTSQSPIPKNLRTSLIIDPPNGRIPARVGAPAGGGGGGRGGGRGAGGCAAAAPAGGRGAAGGGGGGNQYDSIQNMPIGSRCIIMGGSGPPLMDAGYNATYQIVQNKDTVLILTEMIHDVRIIPIDSRPLPPEQTKQWIGFSRGHWEGNTLVVETTNFNGRRPFQGAGQNLRITERFTRVADDKIDYTFTAQDETTWVSPWTASVPLTKEKGPIFEFACHETNYGPANILAGARAAEKAAADAAGKK
jgi:hypothetical protein